MKKAVMRLPSALSTRKVWIGCYGGHFDIVVVFKEKPIRGPKGEWDAGEYTELRNKKIVIGKFGRYDFKMWFGLDFEPKDIGIKKVEQVELTAVFDDEYSNGHIWGLDAYAD